LLRVRLFLVKAGCEEADDVLEKIPPSPPI
jgi:hypothetical protein